MRGRRQGKLQIAPLRLRFAAGAIDAAIGVLVIAVVVASSVGASHLARRRAGEGLAVEGSGRVRLDATGRPGDTRFDARDEQIAERLRSPQVRLPLTVAGFALGVLQDERRSVGSRMVGIRIVDADTGQAVSLKQSLIRVGARRLWAAAASRVVPASRVVADEGLASELGAVRRATAGDEEALRAAVMGIYRARRRNPTLSLLPVYARMGLAAVIRAPVWSPLKQGLPDRLAGTAVVVDRDGSSARPAARA